MCFSTPKPQPVVYDSASRQVSAAADEVARQRRSASGYEASIGNVTGAPSLGQLVLLGR